MSSGLGAAEEAGLWDAYPIAFAIHVIIFVSVLVSMVCYNQRKHIFPLTGRGTREVFGLNCVFLFASLSVAARSPGWPCVCDLIISGVASHCGILMYAYRIVVLLSQHEIANELHFGMAGSVDKPTGCFGRRCLPVFRRSGTLFITFGAFVAIFYFCLAWGLGSNFRCRGIGGVALNVGFAILFFPTFSYLTYRLRKAPNDGRQIYMEFRIMAICLFMTGLITACVMLFGYASFTVMVISDSIGVGLMISSLWFPTYLTFKQDKPYHKLSLSVSGPAKFEELVRVDGFLEAFLLHLKREFNAESLVFWQVVTTFKAAPDKPREDKERSAQGIFDTYVAVTAPFQLNISLESVQSTQLRLEGAKKAGVGLLDVFNSVVEEVLELLQSDPLPRFLRSPAGMQFRPTDNSTRITVKDKSSRGRSDTSNSSNNNHQQHNRGRSDTSNSSNNNYHNRGRSETSSPRDRAATSNNNSVDMSNRSLADLSERGGGGGGDSENSSQVVELVSQGETSSRVDS